MRNLWENGERMNWKDVVEGDARWSIQENDAIEFIDSLPADSVDLIITSPPYEFARTYGLKEKMVGGEEWVAWMIRVVTAASRVCKGVIAINCEGQTRNFRYSGVPYLLAADLHRAGFNLRRPVMFHRIGIPGSGGPDWFRGDTEQIICVTRPGKLPFSDNTACGHPPKWGPGGEMSHMVSNGTRVNQWGKPGTNIGTTSSGDRESPTIGKPRPSHKLGTITRGNKDGDTQTQSGVYDPPTMANPGNAIEVKYTATQVAELLEEFGDLLSLNVGGGMMGHPLAHKNEAPFPIELPEFFIKSCCPPNGIVPDFFCGSGSTIDAAIQNNRRAIGCDLRKSQVELTIKRMRSVTPQLPLFDGASP